MNRGASVRRILALAIAVAHVAAQGRVQQLVVTVRDSNGETVKNLRAADFVVQEGGADAEVVGLVESAESPVSLGILIDTSHSMRRTETPIGGLRAAIGAARLLLRQVKPQDAMQLMSFDDKFSIEEKFRGDPARVSVALDRLEAEGPTALVRALEEAVREMRNGPHRRKALVVISDLFTFEAPERMATLLVEAEVPVYVLVVRTTEKQQPQERIAATVVEAGGGRASTLDVESENAIDQLNVFWRDLLAEVRGQYTLSFISPEPATTIPLALRVRTRNPDHRLRVERP